jgi:imidazolonepropionase
MATLIKNISSLVTMNEGAPDRRIGKEMQNIGEIKNGAILFEDKILWMGASREAEELIAKGCLKADKTLDYSGKTLMPGFIDTHTHIVFGGDRSQEFGKRLRGATYQEIAAEGGGIQTTVRGSREASLEEIVERAKKLAWESISHGTTSMEIKSGYGLDLESELKLLEAIKILKKELPLDVATTFLGAHDFPPEYQNDRDKYVDIICEEMLPKVAELKLAEYCDAFVDKGYYTVEQGEKIFKKAKELGLKIRIHADELACVEAAVMGAKMGAISADHLLFVSDNGINAMKESGTVATLLPCTAFFIRMPYAPARKLIDSGVVTSIASDCNPGSCFTQNLQLAMSFAVINMGMTAEEALTAVTINAAAAIEKSDLVGSLAPGKQADFVCIDSPSYIDMFYHFGVNHIKEVWKKGDKIL